MSMIVVIKNYSEAENFLKPNHNKRHYLNAYGDTGEKPMGLLVK